MHCIYRSIEDAGLGDQSIPDVPPGVVIIGVLVALGVIAAAFKPKDDDDEPGKWW